MDNRTKDSNGNKCKNNVYVVGVAGGTASGKTTICDKILQENKNIVLISMDSFYKTVETQNVVGYNFDNPNALDLDLLYNVVQNLKNGHKTKVPVYNFVTHKREEQWTTIYPKSAIVVEGILLLYSDKIKSLLDMKIYIDAPPDTRLIRRITRDMNERGRTLDQIIQQYQDTVKKSHDLFVEPTKKYADFIVSGEKNPNESVKTIVARIEKSIIEKSIIEKSIIEKSIIEKSIIEKNHNYVIPSISKI